MWHKWMDYRMCIKRSDILERDDRKQVDLKEIDQREKRGGDKNT